MSERNDMQARVEYERRASGVVRRSVGKRGAREDESRAYVVHRFTSRTAADAAAARLNGAAGSGATQSELLKLAARDRRGFLHVTEAAQESCAAQLRAIGSRPSGRFVREALESWDGRGYLAVGDVVITLADSPDLPSVRATQRKAQRVIESIPAELREDARMAYDHAQAMRAAARELRSGVTRKQVESGE